MKPTDTAEREAHPICSVVLMVIGIAIMAGSYRYEIGSFESPGAGFVPFYSGLAMAIFSAVPLLQSFRRGWMPLRRLWEGTKWQRAGAVTAGLLLYCFFLNDLGFLLATMLLTIGFFRLLQKPNWKVTLFAALTTTAGFYLLFQVWLQAQLPRGFLGF
jgi:putative tricarboxylic transport membrane protein